MLQQPKAIAQASRSGMVVVQVRMDMAASGIMQCDPFGDFDLTLGAARQNLKLRKRQGEHIRRETRFMTAAVETVASAITNDGALINS